MGSDRKQYITKQGNAILAYFATLGERRATVEEIAEHLAKNGTPVGVTTIYRHLDKLEQSGHLRKLVVDGVAGACYQRITDSDGFVLMCVGCGSLVELDCGEVREFKRHILQSHKFYVNAAKTVFYGECYECTKN